IRIFFYKGAFYRTTHSMGHFSNQHQFVFTDINNKKYENELQFKNMQLINPPKTFSTTKSLQLSFDSSSCKPGDEITIGTMGSDSSFSESHTISVNDYSVTIPVADLQKQKGKDLWLDISISRDIPLKQNTKEGGKMNLEYKMKPLKLKKG
ncbi:MAG: hypothetical protein ABJA78_09020, partial [Ferruginibacter sp.]